MITTTEGDIDLSDAELKLPMLHIYSLFEL